MAVKDRLAAVPVVGTALAVQDRYKQDAADQLAAAIGFFAFLSLFPLMILAVAAAGFVWSDPADQARVVDLITQAIPGFQATLGEDDTAVARLVANVVDNRGAIGLVGAATLLLTGLRVVNSAMTATTVVLRGTIPRGVKAKLRQVAVLIALGVVAIGAVAASSLAGAPAEVLPRWAALVLAMAISLVLDTGLFLAAYGLLKGTAPVRTRRLLPGAVLAAVGWTVLKVVGAGFVGTQVEDANALYGAVGGIIALLLLLYLAGRLYLYGAELSATLLERREGPLTPDGAPVSGDADGGHDVAVGDAAVASPDPAAPRPRARRPGSAATARAPAPAGSAPSGGSSAAPARAAEASPTPADVPVTAPPVVTDGLAGADRVPSPTSPAVGEATRARLRAAEDRRPRGADVRGAVAFALGVGALAAGWRMLRDE